MMRVVLDANVLLSGLIYRKGLPGQILDAWLAGQFQLFISPKILEELQCILQYPHIHQRLTKQQIISLLEKLGEDAELIHETPNLEVLTRDPSDNIYLACAVKARADYLVTGNSDHFKEAGTKYCGVNIISPRSFLDALKSG